MSKMWKPIGINSGIIEREICQCTSWPFLVAIYRLVVADNQMGIFNYSCIARKNIHPQKAKD